MLQAFSKHILLDNLKLGVDECLYTWYNTPRMWVYPYLIPQLGVQTVFTFTLFYL